MNACTYEKIVGPPFCTTQKSRPMHKHTVFVFIVQSIRKWLSMSYPGCGQCLCVDFLYNEKKNLKIPVTDLIFCDKNAAIIFAFGVDLLRFFSINQMNKATITVKNNTPRGMTRIFRRKALQQTRTRYNLVKA